MARTWGRLYLGTRNHRKLKTLRRRHPGSWKTFYILLELALETDDDGWIYLEPGQPYPLEELADEVDETPENLQSLLRTMADLGLVQVNGQGIQFLSYSERQFKSDADVAERVRRHREAKKANPQETLQNSKNEHACNIAVTLQDRYSNGGVTPPDTDTDTDTDTELDPRRKASLENKPNRKRKVGLGNASPPNGGAGVAKPASKTVFDSEVFTITEELHHELCQRFPVLPPDQILAEYQECRDWCLDNRLAPKHRRKFAADGRLREPRRFLKNWFRKEEPDPAFVRAPPARPLPSEPDDIMVPDPKCPVCRGSGLARDGPCKCLKL
ncbi:MAG: phage replisome organizer N-terminal domain-containing protein, partial [Desulfobaccales bacterium]